MTNKDIHLSLNKQDEISVKKLLTNHKLDKEYTYNKDYIEVVLKNNSKDKLHNEQNRKASLPVFLFLIPSRGAFPPRPPPRPRRIPPRRILPPVCRQWRSRERPSAWEYRCDYPPPSRRFPEAPLPGEHNGQGL